MMNGPLRQLRELEFLRSIYLLLLTIARCLVLVLALKTMIAQQYLRVVPIASPSPLGPDLEFTASGANLVCKGEIDI